ELLLIQALGPLLGLGDRGEHQVFEHLDVARIHDGRIDPDLADATPAIGRDRDHPAAARAGDRLVRELRLELAQMGLHLLAHLQNLLKTRHGRRPLQRRHKIGAAPRSPQAERAGDGRSALVQSSNSRSHSSTARPRTGSSCASRRSRSARTCSGVSRGGGSTGPPSPPWGRTSSSISRPRRRASALSRERLAPGSPVKRSNPGPGGSSRTSTSSPAGMTPAAFRKTPSPAGTPSPSSIITRNAAATERSPAPALSTPVRSEASADAAA